MRPRLQDQHSGHAPRAASKKSPRRWRYTLRTSINRCCTALTFPSARHDGCLHALSYRRVGLQMRYSRTLLTQIIEEIVSPPHRHGKGIPWRDVIVAQLDCPKARDTFHEKLLRVSIDIPRRPQVFSLEMNLAPCPCNTSCAQPGTNARTK